MYQGIGSETWEKKTLFQQTTIIFADKSKCVLIYIHKKYDKETLTLLITWDAFQKVKHSKS